LRIYGDDNNADIWKKNSIALFKATSKMKTQKLTDHATGVTP
jgi:hypothetical protein